jgi:hypothetical protein
MRASVCIHRSDRDKTFRIFLLNMLQCTGTPFSVLRLYISRRHKKLSPSLSLYRVGIYPPPPPHVLRGLWGKKFVARFCFTRRSVLTQVLRWPTDTCTVVVVALKCKLSYSSLEVTVTWAAQESKPAKHSPNSLCSPQCFGCAAYFGESTHTNFLMKKHMSQSACKEDLVYRVCRSHTVLNYASCCEIWVEWRYSPTHS